MKTGQPKFNAVKITDGTFNFLETALKLEARAAFVSTETGGTHGWTTASAAMWSPETITLMKALRDSMEADIAAAHLYLDGEQSSPAGEPMGAGVPTGLSEHLSLPGGEPPSV